MPSSRPPRILYHVVMFGWKTILVVVATVAVVASSCQRGGLWSSCDVAPDGNPFGTDGTFVLACRNGTWEPIMTVQEYAAIRSGRDVTIAPLPRKPPPKARPTTTTTPPPAPPPASKSPVVDLALGSEHACAAHVDGSVSCWGVENGYSQLGFAGAPTMRPSRVVGLSAAVSVESSTLGSCALRSDGSVWCWGIEHPQRRVGQIAGPGSAMQLSEGGSGGCFLEPDRTVSCWVRGHYPEPVPDVSGIVDIASDGENACGLTPDATVICWGYNSRGALGRGTYTVGPEPPGPVDGLDDVVDVSVGGGHACAATNEGDVYCWGDNSDAAVGPSARYSESVPTKVEPLPEPIDRVLAGATSSCALGRSGAAYCWGANGHYALGGNGGTFRLNPTPIRVEATGAIRSLSLGYNRICFLDDEGVKCAGAYSGTDPQHGLLPPRLVPGLATT